MKPLLNCVGGICQETRVWELTYGDSLTWKKKAIFQVHDYLEFLVLVLFKHVEIKFSNLEFQIGDLARYVQERHVDFSVSNIWILNLFLRFFMHSHLKLTQSSRRSIHMHGISFNSMVHSIVRFQKGIYPMQSIIKYEWLSWKNGGCLIWKLCKCHFFWSCFVNLVGWTTDSIGELNSR